MTGSGPKWHGPTEKWPKHSKAWHRAALAKARSAGWWYKKAAESSHIHGTVYCQPPEKRAKACRFVVFSTGEGGESAAAELERLVRRCPHGSDGTADRDRLTLAYMQVEKVEALCRGAQALLDQHRYEQGAAELLDRAEQLLEEAGSDASEADQLLRAAVDLEAEAVAAAQDAEQTLTLASTNLRDPAKVIDLAEAGTSAVNATIRGEKLSDAVRQLRTWVRAAQDRIRVLRSKLTET